METTIYKAYVGIIGYILGFSGDNLPVLLMGTGQTGCPRFLKPPLGIALNPINPKSQSFL